MNDQNIDFSFYKHDSPEKVLAKYIESHNNSYDVYRFKVTADFLKRHLHLEKMNVLEVGCGGGFWSSYFAREAATVTCNDIRPHVVEAAKLFVSRQGNQSGKDNIHWIIGDITNYKFDHTFDLIFLKDIIEHIDDDLVFLQGMARKLSESGLIYIATQNSLSLNYMIEGLYQKIIAGNTAWVGWDPTHVRFYNPRSLDLLAGKVGLRIVAWHGMYHLPYRFLSRAVTKKIIERKIFHWIELHLGETWPFTHTGWSIGALLTRGS